ncbi:hypothetical protein BT63DRAFT_211788 [Microthyrium microscopicum]|uniref:Trm112p-domain-containing protein n=1 Tax=Microthyrium microscopicum TaxID=703497 RepID=A0A6A6UHI8_9PEZI|nr:hypothetical protein BT63DRAFT_211788 [Microthyrium microscopicum]
MKILTLTFLTCARKSCKPEPTSYPLHPTSAELEIIPVDFNPLFLRALLPRLDWPTLRILCEAFGLPGLQEEAPEEDALFLQPEEGGAMEDVEVQGEKGKEVVEDVEKKGEEETREASQLAKDLHHLLLETTMQEGKLVCGCCGHEYAVKEGIANFLLPAHLV